MWFKVTKYGTSSPGALSLWRHVIGIRRFFEYSAANRNGSRFLRREKSGRTRERDTFPGYHAGIVSCEKETSGIERARGPFPGYYAGHCFLRRDESGRVTGEPRERERDSLVMCVCGMRAKSFHVREDEKSSPREVVEANGEAH